MLYMYRKNHFIILAFLMFATDNVAQQTNSLFDIHGFVSQGLIQNSDSRFVNDDDNYSLNLTEVGLNASYQLLPNLRVAGQAVYLNAGNRFDEGGRVDYLLADWNFYHDTHWQHHFYIGRIKNYHWLYSSTRDVPMTRPSIILPQSVYFDGTRDMSVGGDGIALASKYSHERVGEIDINISSTHASFSRDETQIILARNASGKMKHEQDLQTSIYWQPVLSPWRFGVAMTRASFNYTKSVTEQLVSGGIELKRFYINAEYYGEKWTFSSELLEENMSLSGLFFPTTKSETKGQGGFVQLEYKPLPEQKFLLRYERFFADVDDKNGALLEASTAGSPFGQTPHYFGYQHDVTIGFTFNFSTNFKIQLEHHWIHGSARLTPLVVRDLDASPKENWQLSALQLMYWF